jgi:hypothetical protein
MSTIEPRYLGRSAHSPVTPVHELWWSLLGLYFFGKNKSSNIDQMKSNKSYVSYSFRSLYFSRNASHHSWSYCSSVSLLLTNGYSRVSRNCRLFTKWSQSTSPIARPCLSTGTAFSARGTPVPQLITACGIHDEVALEQVVVHFTIALHLSITVPWVKWCSWPGPHLLILGLQVRVLSSLTRNLAGYDVRTLALLSIFLSVL